MASELSKPKYCQVGLVRAAHKDRKSWNPPEAMFLARFSTNIPRKIDLTNAFKSLCRDDSFKPCSKIAGYLGQQRLGCLGERARGLSKL